MSHVPNNRIVPVEKIDGAVRTNIDSRWTKVRIIRGDEILECFAGKSRALLRHFDPEDSLNTDDITVEKIAVEVVGKMAAAQYTGSGTGT